MNRHLADLQDHVNDRGASLVEYVLLFSLIFLVCLASVTAFGEGIGDSIDDSANRVVTATP